MIQVNWQKVQEAFAPSSCHGVAGVISVRPCVCARRQTSVCQQVKDTLAVEVSVRVGNLLWSFNFEFATDFFCASDNSISVCYLVWILFAPHKYDVFQCVWQSIIVVCFGSCNAQTEDGSDSNLCAGSETMQQDTFLA